MVSLRALYNWAAMETASSVELQTKPWHSNSLSSSVPEIVRVMQANIGGCCGSKADRFVYLSSDLAKGQNNLCKENSLPCLNHAKWALMGNTPVSGFISRISNQGQESIVVTTIVVTVYEVLVRIV